MAFTMSNKILINDNRVAHAFCHKLAIQFDMLDEYEIFNEEVKKIYYELTSDNIKLFKFHSIKNYGIILSNNKMLNIKLSVNKYEPNNLNESNGYSLDKINTMVNAYVSDSNLKYNELCIDFIIKLNGKLGEDKSSLRLLLFEGLYSYYQTVFKYNEKRLNFDLMSQFTDPILVINVNNIIKYYLAVRNNELGKINIDGPEYNKIVDDMSIFINEFLSFLDYSPQAHCKLFGSLDPQSDEDTEFIEKFFLYFNSINNLKWLSDYLLNIGKQNFGCDGIEKLVLKHDLSIAPGLASDLAELIIAGELTVERVIQIYNAYYDSKICSSLNTFLYMETNELLNIIKSPKVALICVFKGLTKANVKQLSLLNVNENIIYDAINKINLNKEKFEHYYILLKYGFVPKTNEFNRALKLLNDGRIDENNSCEQILDFYIENDHNKPTVIKLLSAKTNSKSKKQKNKMVIHQYPLIKVKCPGFSNTDINYGLLGLGIPRDPEAFSTLYSFCCELVKSDRCIGKPSDVLPLLNDPMKGQHYRDLFEVENNAKQIVSVFPELDVIVDKVGMDLNPKYVSTIKSMENVIRRCDTPKLTCLEACKLIEALGGISTSNGKGSHRIWEMPNSNKVILPFHASGSSVSRFTLNDALRTAGVTKSELYQAMGKVNINLPSHVKI